LFSSKSFSLFYKNGSDIDSTFSSSPISSTTPTPVTPYFAPSNFGQIGMKKGGSKTLNERDEVDLKKRVEDLESLVRSLRLELEKEKGMKRRQESKSFSEGSDFGRKNLDEVNKDEEINESFEKVRYGLHVYAFHPDLMNSLNGSVRIVDVVMDVGASL
jgi:hypothetical protein